MVWKDFATDQLRGAKVLLFGTGVFLCLVLLSWVAGSSNLLLVTTVLWVVFYLLYFLGGAVITGRKAYDLLSEGKFEKKYRVQRSAIISWLDEHASRSIPFSFRAKVIYKYPTQQARDGDTAVKNYTNIPPPTLMRPIDAQRLICELVSKGVLEPELSRNYWLETFRLREINDTVASAVNTPFTLVSLLWTALGFLKGQAIGVILAIVSTTHSSYIREFVNSLGLVP